MLKDSPVVGRVSVLVKWIGQAILGRGAMKNRQIPAAMMNSGRSVIWNVGITLCSDPVHALSEKLCPFQSLMPCTKSSLDFLSSIDNLALIT